MGPKWLSEGDVEWERVREYFCNVTVRMGELSLISFLNKPLDPEAELLGELMWGKLSCWRWGERTVWWQQKGEKMGGTSKVGGMWCANISFPTKLFPTNSQKSTKRKQKVTGLSWSLGKASGYRVLRGNSNNLQRAKPGEGAHGRAQKVQREFQSAKGPWIGFQTVLSDLSRTGSILTNIWVDSAGLGELIF